MQKALADPAFMKQGGTLAFACQHPLPHESYAFLDTHVYSQFKGADACIVAAALNLGLRVSFGTHYKGVQPPSDYESDGAIDEEDYEDDAGPKPVANQAEKTWHFGAPYSMNWKETLQVEGFDQWVSDWKAIEDKVSAYRNVIWCNSIDKSNYGELGQVYSMYDTGDPQLREYSLNLPHSHEHHIRKSAMIVSQCCESNISSLCRPKLM